MDYDYSLPNLSFFVSPVFIMFLSLVLTSVCPKFILFKFTLWPTEFNQDHLCVTIILEDSMAPGEHSSGQTAKGSNFLSPVIYPQKHSQQ